jgi:hypothetical protein
MNGLLNLLLYRCETLASFIDREVSASQHRRKVEEMGLFTDDARIFSRYGYPAQEHAHNQMMSGVGAAH